MRAARQTPARRIALAAASGLLIFASLPRLRLHLCVWFAFVPLLIALRHVSPGERLRLGFVTGLIGYLGAFYWLLPTSARFFDISSGLAGLMFAAFLLWHPLQFALFAALGALAPGSILFPALLWVVIERLFPMLIPWQLGIFLQPHVELLQLAEITGASGLSFLILTVNALLARACVRRSPRTSFALLAGALAIVGALEGYGRVRVAQVRAEDRAAPRLTVALLQGNLPTARTPPPDALEQSLDTYAQLSERAAGMKAKLIIWPEAALRTYLARDDATAKRVYALAERLDTMLLIGASDESASGSELSAAFLVTPFHSLLGVYHKTRLFPFAERLPGPLARLTGWSPAGALDVGTATSPLLLPGTRFGVSICYEATFAGFFRAAIAGGAEFLVNMTNDAWFGDSSAADHHIQAAVMRAVESRRWLVRAANSGISAIIDPTGTIVAQSALFVPAVLSGEVALRRDTTPFVRRGDWVAWTCGLGLALSLLRRILFRGGSARSLP